MPSGLVIGAIAVALFFAVALVYKALQKEETHVEAPPASPVSTAVDVPFPAVKFTDITRAAGITFSHANGANGEKLLPETMGSGAAFFDYDNDGDQDLLLVNSENWADQADLDEFNSIAGSPEVQPVLAEDEARFLDRQAIRVSVCEEVKTWTAADAAQV